MHHRLSLSSSPPNKTTTQLLKRLLNAARPPHAPKDDGGMPSSHAQSLFFLACYVAVRTTENSTLPHRATIAALLLAAAAALTSLRVVLGYHTTPQVVVGAVLGAGNAVGWAAAGRRWVLPRVAAGDGWVGAGLAVATVGACAAFGVVNVRAWARERRKG